jgi:hypothetical protein
MTKLTKAQKKAIKRQLEKVKPELMDLAKKLPEILVEYTEYRNLSGPEYLESWRKDNPEDSYPEYRDTKGRLIKFDLNLNYRVQFKGLKPKNHYPELTKAFEFSGWEGVDRYMRNTRQQFLKASVREEGLKINSKSDTEIEIQNQKQTSSALLEEKREEH